MPNRHRTATHPDAGTPSSLLASSCSHRLTTATSAPPAPVSAGGTFPGRCPVILQAPEEAPALRQCAARRPMDRRHGWPERFETGVTRAWRCGRGWPAREGADCTESIAADGATGPRADGARQRAGAFGRAVKGCAVTGCAVTAIAQPGVGALQAKAEPVMGMLPLPRIELAVVLGMTGLHQQHGGRTLWVAPCAILAESSGVLAKDSGSQSSSVDHSISNPGRAGYWIQLRRRLPGVNPR